jgi:hypothetical protein
MIAVGGKVRPADNARGRRIAPQFAGVRSVSGRRLGVSVLWVHAMDFLATRWRPTPPFAIASTLSLSIVGCDDLAPGKRVYLLDLTDEKG